MFSFPEVKNSYKFRLEICPKGNKSKKNEDEIGLFLISLNRKRLKMKFCFSLLNNAGAQCEKMSLTFGKFCYNLVGWNKYTTLSKLKANKETLLPGGCLHIQCDFTIFYSGKVLKQIVPVKSCQDTIDQSMERLLSNPVLSDFKLICGGRSFPCHKAILANKSDVLEQLVTSGNWAENKENILEIKDFHPEVVSQMLHFIYTCKIPANSKCTAR